MQKSENSIEQIIVENDTLKKEITRLKIQNSSLMKNFQNVVKKHVDGIVITDFSGIILYMNTSAESMFGYKKEKLIGELFGFPILVGEFSEIDIISKKYINGVGEIRSADIEWRGEEAKLLSIRDITKQKEIEKAIAESEYRSSELIKQSPSIIEIYDKNGLQIIVNEAYEKLWGFGAEQTLNKFNILESEEVIKTGLIEYVKKAYEGESVAVPPYNFDPRGATEARGKGRVRWLSTRIYPLKDKEDKIINIVVTHEDISKIKVAEENLHIKINELQRFHDLTIDREITMIALKTEVNELLKKTGQKEKYVIVG